MAADLGSVYRPLDSGTGEIRLITVKLPADASESGPDAPLEVELSYSPIAEASYDALSYAWGAEADGKRHIFIDGLEVEIGVNLYNFLIIYREYLLDRRDGRPSRQDDDVELMLELADSDLFLKAFGLAHVEQERKSEATSRENNKAAWQRNIPIWVDAICVNQKDVQEKNLQIPRMRSIYDSADAVIVWLGEANETSEKATRFLRKMSLKRGLDLSRVVLSKLRSDSSMRNETVDGVNVQSITPDSTAQTDWVDVVELFKRPYWQRMWVVQELVSSKYAQLWCGSKILGIAAVKRVQRDHWGDALGDAGVRTYLDPRYEIPFSDGTPLADSLLLGGPWPIDAVSQLLKSNASSENNRSLRAVMSLIRLRQATYPKDMIYSLVGILPRDDNYSIPIDYADEYPVAQTFCDFMRYEIQRSKSLEIWQLLTEQHSQVPGLPTWAVDWTGQEASHEYIKMKNTISNPVTRDQLLQRGHNIVYAAGETNVSLRFLDPCSTISVSGFLIGTVDEVSKKHVDRPESDEDAFNKDFGELNDLLELLEVEVTIATLIAIGCCLALSSEGTVIERKDNQVMQKDVNSLKTVVAAGPHLARPHAVILISTLHKLLEVGFDTHRPDLISPSIKQKFWDRRWIVNKRFSTFGSAPARTTRGDILWVPRGCPFVMVLRVAADGKYVVIGTCWLNGFMHGQAARLWEEGRLEEREFILQ